MENHFYDTDGFYIRSGQVGKGLCPKKATRIPLPSDPDNGGEWQLNRTKQWPRWNGVSWELAEDHRQRTDGKGKTVEGTGTAYWLPDDEWQAPARYMTTPGPLPDGVVLMAPEKPLATARQELMEKIHSAYTAALAAALTMPGEPDLISVAVEAAALLVVDADAVDTLRAVLDARRAELEAAVNAAETLNDVENIGISFPV